MVSKMAILSLVVEFPKEELYSLTDQIGRSSRSIGANIAESWQKRRYAAHFVSKLTDADGEQAETQHWLDSCLGGCPRIMSVTKKSENETKFSQI
jgi:four helix bundle protein